MRRRASLLLMVLSLMVTSCADLSSLTGQTSLFVRGEPFIVSGTSGAIDNDGPCLVWYGANGVTYHLFQGGRVSNADFDRVSTPGVSSRLEIATRSDLVVSCEVGTIVEVQRVLEIVE